LIVPSATPANLAEVGFLADCSRQQRERIASLSATLDVGAGRRLCRSGGSDRQFLVIVEGEATVTVDGAEVATLGPGCGFGAVPALTPDGRRGAAVTAATPMTLLVLHRGEFETLVADVPVIARRVQYETASRLSQASANTTQPAPRRHGLSAQTHDTKGRRKGTPVMEVLACLGRTGASRQRNARRAR
jgi:CRP-like cAMP-binding protein